MWSVWRLPEHHTDGTQATKKEQVLVLPGSACQFCLNIPQLLLWPPDICTVNYDTNHMSCAGSPSILTLYPMFILNISINMTDKTASKLEWFMRRPPYHAKYQGEERRKRMFIPSNLHLHFSQCFYNVKTGGLNHGGIFRHSVVHTHTHA